MRSDPQDVLRAVVTGLHPVAGRSASTGRRPSGVSISVPGVIDDAGSSGAPPGRGAADHPVNDPQIGVFTGGT
ncbi:MAG: hypothetical protein R3D53_04535 [Paracoccaceae bacterium]